VETTRSFFTDSFDLNVNSCLDIFSYGTPWCQCRPCFIELCISLRHVGIGTKTMIAHLRHVGIGTKTMIAQGIIYIFYLLVMYIHTKLTQYLVL